MFIALCLFFTRVSIHPFLVTFFSFSSSLTLFLFNASKRSREKEFWRKNSKKSCFYGFKKEKKKGNGRKSIDLIFETRNRSEIARDERGCFREQGHHAPDTSSFRLSRRSEFRRVYKIYYSVLIRSHSFRSKHVLRICNTSIVCNFDNLVPRETLLNRSLISCKDYLS